MTQDGTPSKTASRWFRPPIPASVASQRQRRRLEIFDPTRRDDALEPMQLRTDPMPDAAPRSAPHFGVPNAERRDTGVADDRDRDTAQRVVLVNEERVIVHDRPLPLL